MPGKSQDVPAVGSMRATGVGALAATVVLWSLFALSTRGIGQTSLAVVDAALVRFGVPLLLLSPWLPHTLRAVRRERARTILLVLAGGLPHYLVFAYGAELTSAALTGLLVPGSVPVFVTVLLLVGRRRVVTVRKLVALTSIVAGIVAIAAFTAGGAYLWGVVVLLTAGLLWAVYTLGLQQTNLDLRAVIVLISAVSTAAAAALAVSGAMPSNIVVGSARWSDVAIFALLQGVGTGLLSTAFYALAVRRLGGPTSAVAGALSPVLTALVAVPLFGEPLTVSIVVGAVLIVTGAVAFNAPTRRVSSGTPHREGRLRRIQSPAASGAAAHELPDFSAPNGSATTNHNR